MNAIFESVNHSKMYWKFIKSTELCYFKCYDIEVKHGAWGGGECYVSDTSRVKASDWVSVASELFYLNKFFLTGTTFLKW